MQEVLALQNFFCNVNNYYQLGINLGLDDITLKEIERDFRSTWEKKNEVFQKWKSAKSDASIKDLLKALKEMKENRIADNIEQQFCGESQTHTEGIFQDITVCLKDCIYVFFSAVEVIKPPIPVVRQHACRECILNMLAILPIVVLIIAFVVFNNYYRLYR